MVGGGGARGQLSKNLLDLSEKFQNLPKCINLFPVLDSGGKILSENFALGLSLSVCLLPRYGNYTKSLILKECFVPVPFFVYLSFPS